MSTPSPLRFPLFVSGACWFSIIFLALSGLLRASDKDSEIPPGDQPEADFPALMPRIELKDGDTVVFLGDSITHQCLYTQYVETYCFTRYPGSRIRFHNSGVGGDRAVDALGRFERDVAAFDPDYVTILLGMNDGRYKAFDREVFDTYERDMKTLLDQIAETGAKAVVMTPTIHDARAARLAEKDRGEPANTYYNGVLALFGERLWEEAHRRGLGYVNLRGPLEDITAEQRKTDPAFTMIPDSVHPRETGQVVMAVALIDQMFAKSKVSAISAIKSPNGKWRIFAAGGEVSGVEEAAPEGELPGFSFKAEALPWVLPPEAELGYQLTKAGHRHSGERLTVAGLEPGRYDLLIDGKKVATYSYNQLAKGVELQGIAQTPQHQQALAVALLNQERNDQAMRPLRNWWRERKVRRFELEKWKAENPGSEEIEAKQAEYQTWLESTYEIEASLLAKVKEYDDNIYSINQPVGHHYKVRKAVAAPDSK